MTAPSKSSLETDQSLVSACRAIGSYQQWDESGQRWVPNVAETLRWVREADQATRETLEFQRRLWEDNHIAAPGQGNIPVDEVLQDAEFRKWFAAESMRPLPALAEARMGLLSELYAGLKERLSTILGKTPHLKIFRTVAALYPEAMTTVASSGALAQLVSAMGGRASMDKASRHVWVRHRLDDVLGPAESNDLAVAERMALAWLLYERYVQRPVTDPPDELRLKPLPAARRRRGLTAIKGLFPAALSVLEFIEDGKTRDELLDFLRASSPESKTAGLGVAINAYQSELDLIKREGNQYVLTERGENVLESQDPDFLADWLLTRVLGVDKAVYELRSRGAMKPAELRRAVQAMNPSWVTDFVPQAIIGWLRSVNVVRTTKEWTYELTESGQRWADQIDWLPEALEPAAEPVDVVAIDSPAEGPTLPDLGSIVKAIQVTGHYPPAQIARLHAGLWSHPRRHFAILTGLSGSGKTKLAREYAKALAFGGADARLLTLPVQPGWYDPGALLGFPNPLRPEAYVRTPFLEFVLECAGSPGTPHIVVLDEMNLSHPEQYMAPLLSAMETGEPISLHTEDDVLDGVPAKLPYPHNLVLIGTVNMDETTHGLSDKVLDRAFVLEFWAVELDNYPGWGRTGLLVDEERIVRSLLHALMEVLEPARLHFGWRIVDDVIEFVKRVDREILPLQAALDSVIYAKVLPKLRGEDGPKLREAFARCEDVLQQNGLEQSRRKVAELRADLSTIGSARFWR